MQRNGGVEATRVFTRFWLALFGLWSWDDLPAMPPEVVLLPRWAPLNIYDFACWARQTIVPLTVVAAHRPQHAIPFGIDELRTGRRPTPARPASFTGRALLAPRSGPAPLRAAAAGEAAGAGP